MKDRAGCKHPKPALAFVIDSREQLPYRLGPPRRREFADGGCIADGLGEGDYGVELDGVRLPVVVERKSMSDWFGVVGHGRERFKRELDRLQGYDFAAIVIEANVVDLLRGDEHSHVAGAAALGSALSWAIRRHVHVYFAGDRTHGRIVTQGLLELYAVDWLRRFAPPRPQLPPAHTTSCSDCKTQGT